MDPATSDSDEFVWPFKTTEGPRGDSYENVIDFQRLNNAAAAIHVEYVENIPDNYVAGQLGADIVCDRVIHLEDVR